MWEARRVAKKKGKAACAESVADRSACYPAVQPDPSAPRPPWPRSSLWSVAWPSWPAAPRRTCRTGLFIPKPILGIGGNGRLRGCETCRPFGVQLPVSTPCLWDPRAVSRGSSDTLDIPVALGTQFPRWDRSA